MSERRATRIDDGIVGEAVAEAASDPPTADEGLALDDREGPFWDVMAGRVPPPAAATTLGWRLRSIDPDAGTIEVSFEATAAFTNPIGTVQGGFLAAMLDDTLGPAVVATLPPGSFAPTLGLDVRFLRPVRPGTLIGRGRVTRRTRDVAFLEGELLDADDRVVAAATAIVAIKEMELAG